MNITDLNMPKFLEEKLKKEYGNDSHAVYGTMNKIGAMHGNKETAKGKAMEKKHEMAKKMSAIDKARVYGQNFRKKHEHLTKEGQTALDYPQVRTYQKHLVKKGIFAKEKNPKAYFKDE